jgi:hypothetical protein
MSTSTTSHPDETALWENVILDRLTQNQEKVLELVDQMTELFADQPRLFAMFACHWMLHTLTWPPAANNESRADKAILNRALARLACEANCCDEPPAADGAATDAAPVPPLQ